jgi:hypothetical protein
MSALPAPTRRAAALAGGVALFLLVLSPAAHASRLPADPLAFAPTPFVASQLVADSHAASVQAALADVHGFAL